MPVLAGKPWRSLSDIYANHLESPGTKAYTMDEARRLFRQFSEVRISTVLTHGDLLESDAGQRHRSWLLSMAKRLWPRRIPAVGDAGAWFVHADRGEKVKQLHRIFGARL